MGVFVAGYGVSRFIVEFFRQWDAGLHLAFGWLSRGRQLSIPMIARSVFRDPGHAEAPQDLAA